jgi:hypothetical protein
MSTLLQAIEALQAQAMALLPRPLSQSDVDLSVDESGCGHCCISFPSAYVFVSFKVEPNDAAVMACKERVAMLADDLGKVARFHDEVLWRSLPLHIRQEPVRIPEGCQIPRTY